MARLQSTKRGQSALYSFAVDGGAQSTIGLGIYIPNNSIITDFYVKTNTIPAGASGTAAFGWTGDTDVLMVVTGIAAFVAGECLQGVDFNANPLETTDVREVAITIATTTWTAGILVVSVEYMELDI